MNKKEVLEAIYNMSVLEACQLIKDIEEKFSVSAQALAPIAIEQVVEEVVVEEELDVVVMLTSYGDKRVNVIKAVRSITGLQLKESLELVRSVPVQIGNSMSPTNAEELKRILEDAGGKVNIE